MYYIVSLHYCTLLFYVGYGAAEEKKQSFHEIETNYIHVQTHVVFKKR